MPTVNIQNDSHANSKLALDGQIYVGDANGVFKVDAKAAKEVIGTPGWKEVKKGPTKAKADPTAALRERVSPPPEAAPDPAPAPEPGAAPEPPAEDADEGEEALPELDLGSMTRDQLLATAEEYGVELTAAQKKLKVDDLRAYIGDQIFDEEESE